MNTQRNYPPTVSQGLNFLCRFTKKLIMEKKTNRGAWQSKFAA